MRTRMSAPPPLSMWSSWPPPLAPGSIGERYEAMLAHPVEEPGMHELGQAAKNLLLPLVAGLCLLILGLLLEQAHVHVLAVGLVRDIGLALVVAFVLGVAVDWRLKQGIVTDVVRSALGYVLPEAIRTELLWVTEQHLLDTEYRRAYDLTIADSEWLRLAESVHYNVTNQGRSPERFTLTFAIDEWGTPVGQSSLHARVHRPDGTVELAEGTQLGWHVRAEMVQELQPGATLLVSAEYVSYRRHSDRETLIFVRPTVSPEVTVTVPDGFTWDLSGQYRTPLQTVAPNVKRLAGTCLPFQGLSLRWWPESERPPT